MQERELLVRCGEFFAARNQKMGQVRFFEIFASRKSHLGIPLKTTGNNPPRKGWAKREKSMEKLQAKTFINKRNKRNLFLGITLLNGIACLFIVIG